MRLLRRAPEGDPDHLLGDDRRHAGDHRRRHFRASASPAIYSKDAILESAFASGGVHGTVAFFIGVVAALLTSFYSWRLIFLTFYGKPRWAGSEHIQHAVHHVHEDAGEMAADHDSAHGP